MGKKSDLSDFERGMIVGARRAGSSVSKTADVLGFSRTTVSRVFREWSEKQKTSSNRRSCGRKPLVDERGERRMARIVQSNIRATTKEITTEFNNGTQKVISERTAYRTLCRMGYSNRRPLPAKNKTESPQETQSWTAQNAVWSDDSGSEDSAPAEVPQDAARVSPVPAAGE